MSGSSVMYVTNFSQSELRSETRAVPTMTPGARAITTGFTRCQTFGIDARLTHRTYALSTTSMGTSAGLRTRFVRKNSATGTVSDEKPYPSAPFTVAANSVMLTSAMT